MEAKGGSTKSTRVRWEIFLGIAMIEPNFKEVRFLKHLFIHSTNITFPKGEAHKYSSE